MIYEHEYHGVNLFVMLQVQNQQSENDSEGAVEVLDIYGQQKWFGCRFSSIIDRKQSQQRYEGRRMVVLVNGKNNPPLEKGHFRHLNPH